MRERHKQTNKPTNQQTNKQTNKQTIKQANKQASKQANKQTKHTTNATHTQKQRQTQPTPPKLDTGLSKLLPTKPAWASFLIQPADWSHWKSAQVRVQHLVAPLPCRGKLKLSFYLMFHVPFCGSLQNCVGGASHPSAGLKYLQVIRL